MNPFRYDAATPPPPPQPQAQHKRSYSDVRRGEAPRREEDPAGGMAGVGLSGPNRYPLTFPFISDPEANSTPRWGFTPGAPRIPGLDTFNERDVSPAPGLQRDYARARDEVLRQMQHERRVDDDESVYSSAQMGAGGGGAGWRSFPAER
jgi:hypothetical protein